MSAVAERLEPCATPDKTELVEKLQALFKIGTANPISLRAISPVKGAREARNVNVTAAQFSDPLERWDAAFDAALRLNDEGYNLYTLLNPISPDFAEGAVCDGDITCRRLLLVDLDRAITSKQPATDEEVATAWTVADLIEPRMQEFGFPAAARVMSGNGVHLYFDCELPNNDAARDVCRSFLLSLAAQFDTDTIKVDTGVFNAA